MPAASPASDAAAAGRPAAPLFPFDVQEVGIAGEPCIIPVAITGSVPRRRDNPALPARRRILEFEVAEMRAPRGRPVAAARQARALPGPTAIT